MIYMKTYKNDNTDKDKNDWRKNLFTLLKLKWIWK